MQIIICRAKGFDTAAMSASLLQMYRDRKGVYHATFDCWQQYFGYNDFYDFIFDVFTNMRRKKFDFTYNGQQYILWAWKGDYISLGAGAELGIYYGGEPHWRVNKDLAMKMSMKVTYYGKKIISYATRTWWLTGFNPRYLRINVSKLKVTYKVVFNNKGMYNAFKKKWISKWKFNDKKRQQLIHFN